MGDVSNDDQLWPKMQAQIGKSIAWLREVYHSKPDLEKRMRDEGWGFGWSRGAAPAIGKHGRAATELNMGIGKCAKGAGRRNWLHELYGWD